MAAAAHQPLLHRRTAGVGGQRARGARVRRAARALPTPPPGPPDASSQQQQQQQQQPNHIAARASATLVQRSVAGREHLTAPGSLIVLGDVEHGASLQAGGSVVVWGRLSGHAHAGCQGDVGCTISALELRGAQLVIARATNLGAARVTVPGPHTASVSRVGSSLALQLTPLGPIHPPAQLQALTGSIARWLTWYPACSAALLTGCYALLAGAALVLAPKAVLGLLCDTASLEAGWIQLGGVLLATFGGQYLGAAVADYRLAAAAASSSSSIHFPFRPATTAPPSCTAGGSSGGDLQAAAAAAAGQSVPAGEVSWDEVARLRDAHKASAQASADDGPWQAIVGERPQPQQQQLWPQPQQPPQQKQQAPPPTFLFSSAGFYEASVWARFGLAAAFAALVAAGCCPPGVLVLALLNLLGALGMRAALRRQWLIHCMGDSPDAAAVQARTA